MQDQAHATITGAWDLVGVSLLTKAVFWPPEMWGEHRPFREQARSHTLCGAGENSRPLPACVVEPSEEGSPLQSMTSLSGMKLSKSPSATVVPSTISISPSAQAALRSTPEL